MKTLSFLAALMVLWMAVSVLLWLFYRIFRRHAGLKQERLLASAIRLVEEGACLYGALRMRASKRGAARGNYPHAAGKPGKTLDVRSLLNEVEAQSAYFERVNAAKKRIQQKFNVPDFPALSEILQIRRDFWAASEIILRERNQELGPELGDAQSCQTLQAEARALLFKEGAAPPERDSVELRLAIAREGAVAFQAEAARAVAAELEKSRLPSAAEIIAVLWRLVKAGSAGLRQASHLLGDAAATGRSLASAMSLKELKGAAEELRQARTGMPGKCATAERGGGLVEQGGQGLKQNMLAIYAGLSLFVFAGLAAVGTYSYVSHRNPENLAPFEYALIEGAMFIALSSLFFGARVIMSGLSLPKVVLPPQDRKVLQDLIRDGNEKGIDQYIRLSSLSGMRGAATKLGLTGLPLATMSLTILFSALVILGIDGFLDLAILTLGAFIGSFVQRNLSDEKLASVGFQREPSSRIRVSVSKKGSHTATTL
jgi:hypothetical protein